MWRYVRVALIAIGAYVGCALVLWLILWNLNVPRYKMLVEKGVRTTAKVTRKECWNHGTIYYIFEVGGQEYTGNGLSGNGVPHCHELRQGDEITVYYLPRNPNISATGDVLAALQHEVSSV